MSLPTVFVCGATGTQGGVLTRHLRAKGVPVHAIARKPEAPSAKALEALGVKLWPGDWDNTDALKAAIAGCDTIFLNFMPDFTDMGANLRQAKSIMSIALAAGAKNVVYSSGVSVNEPERMEYWNPASFVGAVLLSKQHIEKAVREAGFEHWTILRPGAFNVNWVPPFVAMYPGLVDEGRWTTPVTPDTLIPTVDLETIGGFSSAAVLDPVRFHGQEIEYADEFITYGDIFSKLSAVTGRDLKIISMSKEEIDAQKDANPFLGGQLLAKDMVQYVDMEKVKSWGVPLTPFDAWVEREKDFIRSVYKK